MIWASMVSAPTLAARTRSEPVVLMVAPMTVSPACLVTGMGSPVTIDSSTADCPDRTVASTGIFSPGRIDDLVADDHLLDRDLGLGAVAQDAGGAGLQTEQRADGLAGAGLGPRFQQPAEQDQGDDDADGLEVHVPHVGRQQPGRDGDEQAVAVRGGGAQGDEAVHVGGAVPQGQPAGAVDRPAGVEHHRRDQSQLQPPVEQQPRHPASRRIPRAPSPRTAPARSAPHRSAPGGSGRGSRLAARRPAPPPRPRRRTRPRAARRRIGGAALALARRVLCGGGLGRFDDQRAVDHVHAAGEPERARPLGAQPHRRAV